MTMWWRLSQKTCTHQYKWHWLCRVIHWSFLHGLCFISNYSKVVLNIITIASLHLGFGKTKGSRGQCNIVCLCNEKHRQCMMIYAHLLGKFGCITQAPKHKIGCIFMLMGQLHNVPFPRCNTVIWLYTDTVGCFGFFTITKWY
jgi:hypothetical protein